MAKPADTKLDAAVLFFLTKDERRKVKKKAERKYDSQRALARYLRNLVLADIAKEK